MKAIYEVKFLDRKDPLKVLDSRRVAREASSNGFQQAAKWAKEVCGSDEFVGSVQLVSCEHL